jgi:1,4-dihydroxy-2-naphthoate octaprenyltransferase
VIFGVFRYNGQTEGKKTAMPRTSVSPRQAWVLAARPKTLPAAISPVIAGTALAAADGGFRLLPALAALAGALLLQIGSNIANDYFDYLKGADTAERIGPTRVTAGGLLPPAAVRRGMVVVFGAAVGVGLYLVVVGGWPIIAVGVASILAALAYTGGSKPYGYAGLGDLFVFLFFGVVAVAGTYYVQTLALTPAALLVSLPVGALITAVLVVNNLRDVETDRRAGKRTLAVRWGRHGARREFAALLAVAYLTPLLLLAAGRSAWVLLPWLTVPLAWGLWQTVRRAEDGPTLNHALAGTARLGLLFSLALALGLLL